MIPKILDATRAYEFELGERNGNLSFDKMMPYEMFEEKMNNFPFDGQELNVFKAMYKSIPTLRTQIEAKYGVDEPYSIRVDNEVASTLKTMCRKLAGDSVNCYYGYHDGKYSLEFEFLAPHIRNKIHFDFRMIPYKVDMGTYIELEECKQWLSKKEEFDVRLVSMDGKKQDDRLVDFLYTSYFNSLYSAKDNSPKPIVRDKTGFSVDMDAVNDRLIEMNYRPFAVPKIEYKAVTVEELRGVKDNSIEEEQDERDDI